MTDTVVNKLLLERKVFFLYKILAAHFPVDHHFLFSEDTVDKWAGVRVGLKINSTTD